MIARIVLDEFMTTRKQMQTIVRRYHHRHQNGRYIFSDCSWLEHTGKRGRELQYTAGRKVPRRQRRINAQRKRVDARNKLAGRQRWW